MTNKISLLFLILICACTNQSQLNPPIKLTYKSERVIVNIELTSRQKNPNNKKYYFYYGIMKSELLTKKDSVKIWLTYKDKKYKIFEDIKFDRVDFFSRSRWQNKEYRIDKIYIDFEDENIDWDQVKISEKAYIEGQPISIEDARL